MWQENLRQSPGSQGHWEEAGTEEGEKECLSLRGGPETDLPKGSEQKGAWLSQGTCPQSLSAHICCMSVMCETHGLARGTQRASFRSSPSSEETHMAMPNAIIKQGDADRKKRISSQARREVGRWD